MKPPPMVAVAKPMIPTMPAATTRIAAVSAPEREGNSQLIPTSLTRLMDHGNQPISIAPASTAATNSVAPI